MSERRSLFSCKNGTTSSDDMRRALKKYYLSSAKVRYSIGPKPKQLIRKCTFDNKLCSENDIILFQNFRYGNCITFNKRRKDAHLLTTAKTGPGTGLVLDLSVNIGDYWRYTESIGVRVVIHDPDATPSSEDEGFNVSPGYEISISLKQTVNHRLPAPFKDKCFNYKVGEKSSASNKNECIRACIQAQNYAQCGCIDQTLTVTNDLSPCNLLNNTEMCCLNEVLDNMANIGPICDCFLPCKSVQYNEVLLEKIVYEQKPMFEGSEIFGYLGGELGLWLGLSVIAVFELLGRMASFGKHMLQREFLKKI
ncbi:degenerin mec-10-like [Argiope bruennichi]|uniref:degenerin mec-10-like n=1 Tax=Argiope bruennichi TaxID=94029 RepID=UPI002494C1E0|nr:degenerin mec-10-like [Argiope bruennichi]